MKSQNLVFNAIKNKGKELILSMQLVVFLTVILSALLYHIENSAQPDNFGDIIDAFIWSLSKFIGGVGGYGDFEPITLWGQVMATIVGLLGIALFAVPAGIIGAGFVEEIEAIKANEELEEKNEKLLTAFNYENQAAAIQIKKLIGLSHIRRRFIKLTSAEFKLSLSRADLLKIADKGKGIQLTTVNDVEVIQSFDENSIYGTFNDRKSNITVISSSSAIQQYLGHFTYAISEYLNANYISSERVSKTVANPKYKYNLNSNPLYISGEISDNIYFEQFKNDMLECIQEKSTVIYFLCSSSKNGSFHILNGGEKGEIEFTKAESTFDDVDKLDNFYAAFEKSLKKFDKTQEKIFSRINKHKFYGNKLKDRFHWFLRNKKNANIVCIYLSPNILKSKSQEYYSIIKILGQSIKDNLL
jgi:voltage-gated potassium channel